MISSSSSNGDDSSNCSSIEGEADYQENLDELTLEELGMLQGSTDKSIAND